MLRTTWVAVAVAVLIGWIGPAQAQDAGDQRARLHFESGASYYEAGEYEDALREFQRAYELSQRPQLFYNLSLCYQNLGDLQQAVTYLERYLNEVPNIENRANLEIRLRNLRERLAHQAAAGTGAGTGTGTTTGTETGTATTETGTGATTTTTTTETATGAETTTATTGTETGATTPAGGGDSLNVGAIAGFSVAAVGLVMAGIFGGLTVAEDSRIAGTPCGQARTCTSQELGDLRTFAAVTDVGFGVALAGAAVGVVFLVIGTGSSSGEHAGIEVTPIASQDGAGIAVGGTF